MKKRLTRGEKWLFASPLLLLALAGIAWRWQRAAPYSVELSSLGLVRSMEFSPDSRRLVVFSEDLKTSLFTGQVVDVEARAKVCDLPLPRFPLKDYSVVSSSWSKDGNRIVSETCYYFHPNIVSKVAVWDANKGTQKANFLRNTPRPYWEFGAVRFSEDGKTIIDEGVPPAIFNAATGKRLNKPDSRFSQDLYKTRMNEELGLVAMRVANQRVQIVDAKTKRILWKPFTGPIFDYGWYDSVAYLVEYLNVESGVLVGENRLLLWDGKTRQPLPTPLFYPKAEVLDYSFSPDHQTLIYSQAFREIDRKTGQESPQKSELVAWNYRTNRVLWRIATDSLLLFLQTSPDGKLLSGATLETDERLHLYVYDRSGKLRYGRGNVSDKQKWSPDSKRLATSIAEPDSSGKRVSRRVEILRFDD